jgi:hypothetical protein
MITRAALTLIAFLLLGASANKAPVGHASADTDGLASAGAHASPASITGQEVTSETATAPFHFEPLLLLLLGSTLFSAGTTIKLVQSRKLDNKSVTGKRRSLPA